MQVKNELFRDIPKTLRVIAEKLEERVYGEVKTAVVVTINKEGEIEVFGLGEGELDETGRLLGKGLRHLVSLENDQMGKQAAYLGWVLENVEFLPEDRQQRIKECKAEIDAVVARYGEDGLMALAISGLEGASRAEIDEEQIDGL